MRRRRRQISLFVCGTHLSPLLRSTSVIQKIQILQLPPLYITHALPFTDASKVLPGTGRLPLLPFAISSSSNFPLLSTTSLYQATVNSRTGKTSRLWDIRPSDKLPNLPLYPKRGFPVKSPNFQSKLPLNCASHRLRLPPLISSTQKPATPLAIPAPAVHPLAPLLPHSSPLHPAPSRWSSPKDPGGPHHSRARPPPNTPPDRLLTLLLL